MRKLLTLLLLIAFAMPAYAEQDRFWVLSSFEKGLNSHISPLETPDSQATEAQNVRFNKRYGALSKRNILSVGWDAGSSTVNALHRYYKSDGTSKVIIATSTYLDIGDTSATTTTHICSGLSDGKRWQFSTFKDIAIGNNGYNQPVKYDGHTLTTDNTTTARTAGELCAELGAPFAKLLTGANLTASKWYQYKMMFLVGGVTYYSDARSNPILTGAAVRDITLTDIPIGPVGTTARYVYRTAGDASKAAVKADTSFYLAATIADNTTITLADTMADATLTEETAWSTTSKYPCTPPKGKYCTVHKERLWVAGDTTYQSYAYFSDDGNPDFFGPDDFFIIRADDGDSITFIKTFLGTLTLGKTNTIQKIYSDSSAASDWYVSDPFSFIGCPAPYSVDISPIGIFYLGRKGIYKFDGQTSSLISDAVTKEINDISQTDIAQCVGIYFNNEYKLSYTSMASGVSNNNRTLIYNLIRDAYVLDTINANCWIAFNSGTDTGIVYSGSALSDGYVYGGDYEIPLVNIRYKSEFDEGTYDDTRVYGTEGFPIIELGWDCTIDTWLTELQTKDASIDTIDDIVTYLPDATIDRPDTSGTWESPVYYINASLLDKLYWNESLGGYGDITFQVRLGPTSDLSAIDYNTAVTNPNGSDLSSITANTYILFRANLSTTDIDYSSNLYQADGYVFRLIYKKTGITSETTVLSLYKTGWKDFKIAGYKKMIKRIRIFYSGTSGDIEFNIKGDDGDIDKTFTIDLSIDPTFSTTDEYTGDEGLKIYEFLPPINSPTEPSLISNMFQFLIIENGIVDWDIYRVEIMYSAEEIY